jgi:hypothetical protein
MATEVCIYCGRTLDSSELVNKAGKYRCKNEQDCLDYQTRDDSADFRDDPQYMPNLVKSSLSEAAERIAAYKTQKDNARISEEAIAEFVWMKAVIDALVGEYHEKPKFAFQYDENNNEYKVYFNDADHSRSFIVKIGILAGLRYSLIVAKADRPAGAEDLYQEFIYKSYPGDQREDVIKDLSFILLACEGEEGLQSALLSEFRREIESRQYHDEAV